MVTAVGTVTVLVVTANVAVVAPAGTVTEAGTVAALVLLLVSATTAPPAGAALPSVTLPVLPSPPVTAAGVTVTPTSARIQRQRGDRGRANACGRDVGLRRDRHRTGGDRERCVVAPAATVHRGRHRRAFGLLLVSVTTAPPDWRRAGERHCAGAIRRAADQYRKGSASRNPAAGSRRARLIWRCHRKWR